MLLNKLVLLVWLLSVVYCQFFLANILEKATNLTLSKFNPITEEEELPRKKKHVLAKYGAPLLLGALMLKSIIFPLAFKAMAVMSSIAVLLSTLSLIISSIVGYIKLSVKSSSTEIVPNYKLSHKYDDENFGQNYHYSPTVDINNNNNNKMYANRKNIDSRYFGIPLNKHNNHS